jgi:hypothetical protein
MLVALKLEVLQNACRFLNAQQYSYNLAPIEPDRCQIIKYSRLSDSTYIVKPALRVWHLLVILISAYKDFAFSSIIGPVMGLLSQHIVVNHWYNILSNWCNLGCSNICHLKGPLNVHILLSTIITGASVSLYYRQLVILCCMKPSLPLGSHHFQTSNYSTFLRNH